MFPISIRDHLTTSEESTPALGKHSHAFMDIQTVHQHIVRHRGTKEPCSSLPMENWKPAFSKNGSHGFASRLVLEGKSFGAATKCHCCIRDNEAKEREGGRSLSRPWRGVVGSRELGCAVYHWHLEDSTGSLYIVKQEVTKPWVWWAFPGLAPLTGTGILGAETC